MNTENNFKQTRVGFIGAGKVGHSLGKYISCMSQGKPCDVNISGYYSKSLASAESAAVLTESKTFNSLAELINNSDIVFLTVPDGMISIVWREIVSELIGKPFNEISDNHLCELREIAFEERKLFCHCSGSLSSSIFENVKEINASACSFHPMYAIADKMNSYKELSNACFTFEGDDDAYSSISSILSIMPNSIGRLDESAKTLYHAACVFFSNLVVGVARDGENILRKCGLNEEFAKNAWHALFLDNAKNIVNKGTTDSLTGPAERADISTIHSHIAQLHEADNNDILSTYCTLTKSIVEIAEEKHPDRDYSEIIKLLGS